MLAGTGSDVGKSILSTALCRIFLQDGYSPVPFKAQNMALNSFVTPDGCEIGRAQAVQAEACGIPPHADMNPVLLKPNSEHTTQVVLNGHPIGNRSAYDYFRKEGREGLREAAEKAFDRLRKRGFNPIVMEGAGSVSELNLRESDLANMPMARYADADVLLVADIDRGGVFASCYGSVMLQEPDDRKRIKGIVVNKFRGDLRLFENGRRLLEQTCGVPVLGVVPMLDDLAIEEEDSVELARKQRGLAEDRINVAVVLLRHISNYTDFDVLERDGRVNLFYTDKADEVEKADVVVLPGTKSTLDDLSHLRRSGMAGAIFRAHKAGAVIVGICGGFQMLGRMVCDPDGVEGTIKELPGLGLLDIHTLITPDKITRQVDFEWNGTHCSGYEIHQGRSFSAPHDFYSTSFSLNSPIPKPLVAKVVWEKNVVGTYVHGFFDNPSAVEMLLEMMPESKQGHSDTAGTDSLISVARFKEKEYDRLAEHVRRHVDISRLYEIMTND